VEFRRTLQRQTISGAIQSTSSKLVKDLFKDHQEEFAMSIKLVLIIRLGLIMQSGLNMQGRRLSE
jgi:hypothetical protein